MKLSDEMLVANVWKAIQRRGVTTSELAKRSGVSVSALDRWLSGSTKRPMAATVAKVAQALGTTVTALLTGTRGRATEYEPERIMERLQDAYSAQLKIRTIEIPMEQVKMLQKGKWMDLKTALELAEALGLDIEYICGSTRVGKQMNVCWHCGRLFDHEGGRSNRYCSNKCKASAKGKKPSEREKMTLDKAVAMAREHGVSYGVLAAWMYTHGRAPWPGEEIR